MKKYNVVYQHGNLLVMGTLVVQRISFKGNIVKRVYHSRGSLIIVKDA